ncbi:hypothetical protein C0991_009484 [Blastosporella zonata]|nr:hypothetical protein C0991_009484 [Blastosporella zonata]
MSDGDKAISPSDAIFARGYAAAIKPLLGVTGAVGQNQLILTSPPTQRGIAAGSDVDSKYTNYQIYKMADALQDAETPVLGGSDVGSYIDQLENYVAWIHLPDAYASETNKKWLKNAEAEFASVAKASRALEKEARKDYKDDGSTMSFEQWASINYEEVGVARRKTQIAETDLQQAQQAVNGALASKLQAFRKRFDNAKNQRDGVPGYNMKAMPQREATGGTTYVPEYSIDTYPQAVEHWYNITKGTTPESVKRDQIVKIQIDQGQKTSWKDLGFKDVRGGGRVGFWPFLYADVKSRHTVERRELNTEGQESNIDVKLAMVGVLKFDVKPGLWDAADIKTLFPDLRPGHPEDVLGPKFARVTSVLVGYDVQLTVNFGAKLAEEVGKIYDEVKENGGGLTIFGIRVSVEAGGRSKENDEYRFDGIKWDKTKGSLTLTPSTGQLTPTFLGAVAQRFH